MRWQKRWSTGPWDGALINSNRHSAVMTRGSLMITTAVAAMLLWQLLPMQRHQENALPQTPLLDEIDMRPEQNESTPASFGAIRLPAPPLVVKTETAPESNPENNTQADSAVRLTPVT